MAPLRTRSKREQLRKLLKHTVSKDRNHASRRVTTRQPINQVLGNQQTTRRERQNDDIIIKFQKTIQFNKATGRYYVQLPWKLNKHNLPTNFILCKRQLNSLPNSLNKKEPGIIKKYNKQMLEQVNLGFIEQVRNLNLHEGILHYIAHFPVFKTDSATTKMRIVYDASARVSSDAVSLNDCLHTGPNVGFNWYPTKVQDSQNSLHSRYRKSFPTK